MLQYIARWSLRNRPLVLVLTAVVVVLGLNAARTLPIDAVPDITNIQVQILTNAPALGPLEVESFVTIPVERSMSGLPRVTDLRSVSKFGLSQVTVVFEDGTDIYRARQLVAERLQEARDAIPEGYGTPEVAPLSTGLGEVYQFEVRGRGRTLMELRSILDGYISPQLRNVPGVVDVNTFGGELRTYQLELDPALLQSHQVSLRDVIDALQRSNGSAGGAYIERHREQLLIRGDGLISTLDDLGDTVIANGDDGVPILARHLGRVSFAPEVRHGAVTRDGNGEIVAGVVMMMVGENSRAVVDRVRTRVAEIQPRLPAGVRIEPFYDRAELIRATIATVVRNLVEGGALVIVVLFLFLRNLRSGIVVASLIPLSMLVAFLGMRAAGVSGNLMSLGAIDFGLAIDTAIIIVENSMRRMSERYQAVGRALTPVERDELVLNASVEVRTATAFGELITALVYVPILTLAGIEGKMFRPMALTVLFSLPGTLVLSITLAPVLASLMLPLRPNLSEGSVIVRLRRTLSRVLDVVFRYRAATVGIAFGLFVAAVGVAMTRGAEFIPELDEGAIALEVYRPPSMSLTEATHQTTRLEQTLLRFPEVESVVCKTGRSEIAVDPMGVEMSDVLVTLKPRDTWRFASRDALIDAASRRIREQVPGIVFGFSQPIEMRMNELIAGSRADIAVKLFGDDLEVLRERADLLVHVLRQVPGAEDVRAEQITGLPMLRVHVDRQAAARYGVRVQDVLDSVAALGGIQVTQVHEGALRYAVDVRVDPATRHDLSLLESLPVGASGGQTVPLSQVTDLEEEIGPAQVSREDLERRITVQVNVRGRDVASFVAEAQRRVEREVHLPPRYRFEWGGQFEHLQSATSRLTLVIPLVLLLILVLLYTSFGALRPAAIIFLNVPLSVAEGWPRWRFVACRSPSRQESASLRCSAWPC